MSDVTLLLSQLNAGDKSAADKLLSIVYDELRRLAARASLSTTARSHMADRIGSR